MVKDGPTLRTLYDVWAFMLGLPEATQLRQSWQKAAELLMAASDHAARLSLRFSSKRS